MAFEFRWNAWNVEHIASHGVSPEEAELVVNRPARGYPREARNESYEVHGQTASGVYLKVVYVVDPEPGTMIYVIHARPLTEREKRRIRSRRRQK